MKRIVIIIILALMGFQFVNGGFLPQSLPPCNYYEILGVPRTATADQIEEASSQLGEQYDPDEVGKLPKKEGEAQALQFDQMTAAYDTLTDPELKAVYDLNWDNVDEAIRRKNVQDAKARRHAAEEKRQKTAQEAAQKASAEEQARKRAEDEKKAREAAEQAKRQAALELTRQKADERKQEIAQKAIEAPEKRGAELEFNRPDLSPEQNEAVRRERARLTAEFEALFGN